MSSILLSEIDRARDRAFRRIIERANVDDNARSYDDVFVIRPVIGHVRANEPSPLLGAINMAGLKCLDQTIRYGMVVLQVSPDDIVDVRRDETNGEPCLVEFRDSRVIGHATMSDLTAGTDHRDCFLPDANFSLRNLHNTDFRRAYLPGATFGHSIIIDTCFADATLTQAGFVRAQLKHVDLTNVQASSATFAQAHLDSCVIGGDLDYAAFDQAVLFNVNFVSARAQHVNFQQARTGVLRVVDSTFVKPFTCKTSDTNLEQLLGATTTEDTEVTPS